MTESDSVQTIRLDHFLKVQGVVDTGGQAKMFIQGGGVTVNGEVETRRGRKLKSGDVVSVDDWECEVEFGADGEG